MLCLDYFFAKEQECIFIYRCDFDNWSVIGRISYLPQKRGDIIYRDCRYEKAGFHTILHGSSYGAVTNLPYDCCLVIPKSSVTEVISPRQRFANCIEHLTRSELAFVYFLVKECGIDNLDLGLIGSRLFASGGENGDLDVVIYGKRYIKLLENTIKKKLTEGTLSKLALAQDKNDQARMRFYGISKEGMQQIRTAQWFRKFFWGNRLVTISFSQAESKLLKFSSLNKESQVEGRITENEDSYFPPFLYRIEVASGVSGVLSLSWFFRHAFDAGQLISAKGSLVQMNGEKFIFVRERGHYIRPL